MITLLIASIMGIVRFVLSLIGFVIRIAFGLFPIILIWFLFVPRGLFFFRPMPFMFFNRHRCGRRFYR